VLRVIIGYQFMKKSDFMNSEQPNAMNFSEFLQCLMGKHPSMRRKLLWLRKFSYCKNSSARIFVCKSTPISSDVHKNG
jgi:hypothetical protein